MILLYVKWKYLRQLLLGARDGVLVFVFMHLIEGVYQWLST